jgi:hypothetical protein
MSLKIEVDISEEEMNAMIAAGAPAYLGTLRVIGHRDFRIARNSGHGGKGLAKLRGANYSLPRSLR